MPPCPHRRAATRPLIRTRGHTHAHTRAHTQRHARVHAHTHHLGLSASPPFPPDQLTAAIPAPSIFTIGLHAQTDAPDGLEATCSSTCVRLHALSAKLCSLDALSCAAFLAHTHIFMRAATLGSSGVGSERHICAGASAGFAQTIHWFALQARPLAHRLEEQESIGLELQQLLRQRLDHLGLS